MNTPHGPVSRTQGLRSSGAAGTHRQGRPRGEEERQAVADQDEDPRARYFGFAWNGTLVRNFKRTEVPKEPCAHCREHFAIGAQGWSLPTISADGELTWTPYHRKCLAVVMGAHTGMSG